MRWPGLFRRRRENVVAAAAASERPKLWAEVALPPGFEAPIWSPAEEPVIEAFAPALVGTRSAVRLGFADGSSLELDDMSGESQALREVAGRLTTGERGSPT